MISIKNIIRYAHICNSSGPTEHRWLFLSNFKGTSQVFSVSFRSSSFRTNDALKPGYLVTAFCWRQCQMPSDEKKKIKKILPSTSCLMPYWKLIHLWSAFVTYLSTLQIIEETNQLLKLVKEKQHSLYTSKG